MKILEVKTITGPNVFSHNPVLVMKLDLESLAGIESCDVPGFTERLLELLPGIENHHCGLGRHGGFLERLRSGTYFGHIVEHVALELTDAAGISVNRGKTVSLGKPGIYLVAVEYKSEPAMKELLATAVDLVVSLVNDQPFDLDRRVEKARSLVGEGELGPSTRAIVSAAESRGIPWWRADEQSLVRLGYGKYRKFVEGTIADSTRLIGVDIAGNKDLTKRFLERAGIPVPRGVVVRTPEEAIAALEDIGGPVAVKPLDGNQGKGVSLNVSTQKQILEAFEIASAFSADVIVEQMLRGRDYRVVVVNWKVVAAAERMPPHVWGDGRHTIQQLIDLENANPVRGNDHEKPLTKIKLDPVALAILEKYNRTLDEVPSEGDLVILRESANLSTGGSARDVTDSLHPTVRIAAERAARAIGLDICGIDFVLPDISQPLDAGTGGIVEVNAAPGIRMHHFPSEGQPRDVGGAIVDMMYPAGTPSRIPIASVTGTNGKTTTARMIAHALAHTGRRVGLTTTEGVYIAGEEVAHGDMTGPWSAGMVLNDDTVDVAVLETARGGIFRSGLGYDWSDVAVLTNIQLDHIGQDGIETVEDILWIKRLIAERVREGGTLILNADDEHLRELGQAERTLRVPKSIVYFSTDAQNPFVRHHVEHGGTAYVVHGEWLEEHAGNSQKRIVRANAMPVTLGGMASFQVSNALAAIAAARALGVTPQQAAEAMLDFSSERHNAGRMNMYSIDGVYVLLDYGHNPAAFRAVCDFVAKWKSGKTIAVLGLPGDRSDALVVEAARMAACGFDRFIVREDKDLRGRREGEVPGLIRSAIERSQPRMPLLIIPDEATAIRSAIQDAHTGDLIVFFCEKVQTAMEMLRESGASLVTNLQRLETEVSQTPEGVT
jgi:cyanophycin synthetase